MILEGKKKKKKKKKKCNWPYYDKDCPIHGWLFPPFFGKDKDSSAATISTAGPGSRSGSGPAYPGAGGINMPGVPGGPGIPNTGMGPTFTSREISGNVLVSDYNCLHALMEQRTREDAMYELATKYLDRKTRFKIINKKMKSGYLLGYAKGAIIEIERDMSFPKGSRIGNFLQRQVNLSMPNQRIQTAVKVINVIYDVLDGTFLVNNNSKDTKEFVRLAREALG